MSETSFGDLRAAQAALLDWLSRNGDDAVKAAVANRRSAEPTPPPPSSPSSSVTATNKATRTPRKKKVPILVGAGIIVVVVAVVVGLAVGGVFKKAPSLSVDQYKSMLATMPGDKTNFDIDSLFDNEVDGLYHAFSWSGGLQTGCGNVQGRATSDVSNWTVASGDDAWAYQIFGLGTGDLAKSD